jgi:GT2 family glycosyltransferase
MAAVKSVNVWIKSVPLDLRGMHKFTGGIVVPTLGTRPEYLRHCLTSIRAAGDVLIHIVAPSSVDLASVIEPGLFDAVIDDPGLGLAAAIDAGLRSFPDSVVYINWLGDDDELVAGALRRAMSELEDDSRIVLVYGGCEYIDGVGKRLWMNKSGNYAKYLMRFGPQLIPQPGALFRRDAYEQIGGLDGRYKWAFDLDLLIRLTSVGKLHFLPTTLGRFRWHEGSLSVGGRQGSVREASVIRIAALPAVVRVFAPLWESPIRWAIMRAGERLTARSKIS